MQLIILLFCKLIKNSNYQQHLPTMANKIYIQAVPSHFWD